MFENLRRAFREAMDNFNREMERDAVPDAVDGLLHGMEKEAASTKAGLGRLKAELEKARARATAEEESVAVCRRRERLARNIGDDETADVAATFAEKHERRAKVLAARVSAVEAEVRLGESEYDDMIAQIRKARAQRGSLAAQAGRTQARRAMGGADDLFGEMDRMAEKIEGKERKADAARDVGGAGAGASRARTHADEREFEELGRAERDERLDERLTELKRRMGRR